MRKERFILKEYEMLYHMKPMFFAFNHTSVRIASKTYDFAIRDKKSRSFRRRNTISVKKTLKNVNAQTDSSCRGVFHYLILWRFGSRFRQYLNSILNIFLWDGLKNEFESICNICYYTDDCKCLNCNWIHV